MKTMFVWENCLAVHAEPTASCNVCPHHSAIVIAHTLEEAHFLLTNLNAFVNDVLRGECAWVDHQECACERANQLDRDFTLGLILSPPSEALHCIDPALADMIVFEDTRTEVP